MLAKLTNAFVHPAVATQRACSRTNEGGIYIYLSGNISIYMCVCVCVCVCERERETERERDLIKY